MRVSLVAALLGTVASLSTAAPPARAGQAPGAASSPDIPISHRDRFYTSNQFSNTVSVIDPIDNKLLGEIRLGDLTPENLNPLYYGQLLVHGMGFSSDHKTLLSISIGSNSVACIDTATNKVKHVAYVGRSPHEAFFTQDGKEVWVSVRGENYISVLDAETYAEKSRITVPNGPGMVIFSPDGTYAYVVSSFTPETVVIATADHSIVGRVKQDTPFSPNLAATPDGTQVWFALKDSGRTTVFDARPPFTLLKTIDTGPITNHVNIVRNANGQFAYVTVGGLNVVKVFDTRTLAEVAEIPTGALPHGIWPSGDGTRVYVGLENAAAVAAIDTLTNKVIANIPIGQAPQGVAYVPAAVPEGPGTDNLRPLGIDGNTAHLVLGKPGKAETQVSLFDQGLVQVLQAAVTGLKPKEHYVIAFADDAGGTGKLEQLVDFMTNPAGAAIVDVIGPIRQVVTSDAGSARRYLVIAPITGETPGVPVQLQQ